MFVWKVDGSSYSFTGSKSRLYKETLFVISSVSLRSYLVLNIRFRFVHQLATKEPLVVVGLVVTVRPVLVLELKVVLVPLLLLFINIPVFGSESKL